MKRILFVCYGGGHVNMVIPVLRKLTGRSDIHCEVLGLTTAASVLRQAGFSPLGFSDFLSDDDSRARQMGELLAGDNTSGMVAREESVAYLGLSYHDLEMRYGVDDAADIYARKGRQGFLPITILERIMTQLKPDLVVATNSPRAEQAAILAARNLGIPAICMIDLFALQEIEWIGKPGYADRICVLSEKVADALVAAGRRREEVVVTGNPAFDRLARPRLEEDAVDLRAARNWGKDWVILWASQPEPERHPFTGQLADTRLPSRVLDTLLAALERHHDWRLVIRPHPSEARFECTLPPRTELSDSGDELPLLLKSVDVVVTMTSTVGLEAVLLHKPLVTVDISVFTADMPYADLGLSHGVSNLTRLESAIVEVRNGAKYSGAGMGEVGRAADNVIDVIEELLGRERD